MTPADRAERLKLVHDDEIERIRREENEAAAKRRHGSWRWRFVGEELQLRSRVLPTLPLDLLRAEAADLMAALAKALNEKPPKSPRMSKREREQAKKARGAWNKAHAVERAYALKQLAEEFAATGGW